LAVGAVNGQAVIFDSGDRRMGQTNINDVSQDFSQFYPMQAERNTGLFSCAFSNTNKVPVKSQITNTLHSQ